MRKKAAEILCVFLLAAVLSACSGQTDTQEHRQEVQARIVMPSMDTFRQMMADEASAAAKERGVELEVVASESSDGQVELIKEGAEKGCDIILCNPVDANTALQLEVAADGIPVVFLNSCPKESLLKEGQFIYSGSDEREAGAFQAEYVLEALAGQDELDVVILKGEQGHSATIGRTEAAKQVLEDSGKKIHYVFEDYAQWDEEKAKHMFDIFLKAGSLPDCVICNNDNMALGVARSCREHDIDPSSILILGVDATADGCQAVADGDMCFTVCQSASGQGRAAVDVVEALAAGRGLADVEYATDDGLFVYVPFEPVTKENVEEYR